jgi:membrane protein
MSSMLHSSGMMFARRVNVRVSGLHGFAKLLQKTFINWSDHNAPRLGAALAFYTLLSLAPLVIILVPISAMVVGTRTAETMILQYASSTAGHVGAEALRSLIDTALRKSGGALPGLFASLTLLFGASSMFAELRTALNQIWNIQPPRNQSFVRNIAKRYLLAIGTILALDIFLLVSVTVTAMVANMGQIVTENIHIPALVLEVFNLLLSFLFSMVLVILTFRFIPDRYIEWRYIWRGALATAILQTIGKFLLGFYLGTTGVGSSYGAASSVVAIAVWIYYSTQILFLGAEFTNAYADAEHSQTRTRNWEAVPA